MSLRLDWCSHEAAKFAVERWHYSRKMPTGPMVKVGVWEGEEYVGAVLFSHGASPQIGAPYNLSQFEVCELTRIALRGHAAPVSRIGAVAVRLLRGVCPGLRLIVSYADPEKGHHGGIYQAMGWVYVGTSQSKWTANGQHNRIFGTSKARARAIHGPSVLIEEHEPKFKYLYPLDAEMRARIAPLAKPYPKRARSIDSDAPGFQPGEGGATPTRALQPSEGD